MDENQQVSVTETTANEEGPAVSSQMMIVAKQGTVKNVVQAIIQVGPIAWIAGVIILSGALLLVAGMFNIPSLQRILPTPTAFAPAIEGESLILVADFDNRSAGEYNGLDPAQYIYEQLVAQRDIDRLDLRIERLREKVDDNTVGRAGEKYGATLVVWGWYDAVSITPRIERTKTISDFRSAFEGLHFGIADRKSLELRIVNELPTQATVVTFVVLGVEELYRNHVDSALTYFDSAVSSADQTSLDPQTLREAYYFRGFVYMLKADFERAKSAYDAAIEVSAGYSEAFVNRAMLYVLRGDLALATEDLLAALELYPALGIAHLNLGTVYLLEGDYEASVEQLTLALQSDDIGPSEGIAYNNRGVAYLSQGLVEQAEADLLAVIGSQPGHAVALGNLGWIHCLRGITQFATLEPGGADSEFELSWDYLGRAIQSTEEDASVEQLILDREYIMPEEAKRVQESHLLLMAGTCRFMQGITSMPDVGSRENKGILEDVIATFDQIVYLQSDNALGYFLRALAFVPLMKFDEAASDLDSAIEIEPEFGMAYLLRAGFHMIDADNCFEDAMYEKCLSELDSAIDYFHRALRLSSEGEMIPLSVFSSFYESPYVAPFLPDFEELMALISFPIDMTSAIELSLSEAHYTRGLAFAALGDYLSSLSDYEEASRYAAAGATAFPGVFVPPGSASQPEVGGGLGSWIPLQPPPPQSLPLPPPPVDPPGYPPPMPYATVFLNRGHLAAEEGDLEEAILNFTHSINLDSDMAISYFERASAYRDLGDHDAAMIDLTHLSSMELSPELQRQVDQLAHEFQGR